MDTLRGSLFQDRRDAGRKLAGVLQKENMDDAVILALPRGGVVVADEVAKSFRLPLEVVISRKIGAPGHPEYGIGALSENNIPSFNSSVAGYFDPESPAIRATIEDETEELKRRVELYRSGNPLPDMKNKKVIVIDDGLATGVTAVAAAKFLKTLHPRELILAVPVGPDEVGQDVEESYDRVICPHALSNLRGVGLWYDNFDQVEDDEVLEILETYH